MEPLRDFQIRHLAAIVQSSDDAIVSKDLNGIVQSWNAAAERMFGYSPAEAIGRSITLIIPPDRLAEEDEILSRIRRGDAVDHFETWRRRKDGILIPVSLTISPVRDDNGVIIGASKIARDISERRRAEQLQAERAELQRRLSMLVDASGTLLASLKLPDVMPAVLRVARELIQADAYAVWRFDDHANGWRIGAADGLSRAFHQFVAQSGDEPSGLALEKPLPVTDVAGMPMLAARRDLYATEGIRSLLIVPLVIGGRRTGTFVLYHKQPHQYSFVEVQIASALGNLAANAIRTGELYDEQRHSRDRGAFLAAAGATLTSSLDLHETLRALANLAVPAIADWCTVDILTEDGSVERVAVSHKDPE